MEPSKESIERLIQHSKTLPLPTVSAEGKERIAELLDMPESVQSLFEAAHKAEFSHYIFDTLGYDVSALDDEDFEDVYHDYTNLVAEEASHLHRVCACRAFAYHVREHGGPECFGLEPAVLAEWF